MRRTAARCEATANAGAIVAGCREEHLHFLDLPFYRTGTIAKKPLTEDDIRIIRELIERVDPVQLYVAGVEGPWEFAAGDEFEFHDDTGVLIVRYGPCTEDEHANEDAGVAIRETPQNRIPVAKYPHPRKDARLDELQVRERAGVHESVERREPAEGSKQKATERPRPAGRAHC